MMASVLNSRLVCHKALTTTTLRKHDSPPYVRSRRLTSHSGNVLSQPRSYWPDTGVGPLDKVDIDAFQGASKRMLCRVNKRSLNTRKLPRYRRFVPTRGTSLLCQASSDTDKEDQGEYTLVIGVGTRGCTLLDECIKCGRFPDAEFCAMNTDMKSLQNSQAATQIVIPASSETEIEIAMTEVIQRLERATAVVVLLAASDGPTGLPCAVAATTIVHGAAERGVLSAAVVAKPFSFEGSRRVTAAQKAVNVLQECASVVVEVQADALLQGGGEVTAEQAAAWSNDAVLDAVECVAALVAAPEAAHSSASGLEWLQAPCTPVLQTALGAAQSPGLIVTTSSVLPQASAVGVAQAATAATHSAILNSPYTGSQGSAWVQTADVVLCMLSCGPHEEITRFMLENALKVLARAVPKSCRVFVCAGEPHNGIGQHVKATLLVTQPPGDPASAPPRPARAGAAAAPAAAQQAGSSAASEEAPPALAGAARGTRHPGPRPAPGKQGRRERAPTFQELVRKAAPRGAGRARDAAPAPPRAASPFSGSPTRATRADAASEATSTSGAFGAVVSEQASQDRAWNRMITAMAGGKRAGGSKAYAGGAPGGGGSAGAATQEAPAEAEAAPLPSLWDDEGDEAGAAPWSRWDAADEDELAWDDDAFDEVELEGAGFSLSRVFRNNEAKPEPAGVDVRDRISAALARDRAARAGQYVVLTYPDGGRYEGEWGNGMQEGHGCRNYTNGDWYEGSWSRGQRDGWGTAYSGGHTYKGHWNNGLPQGHGTLEYPNGDVLEGVFVNGQAESLCKLVTKDGEELYHGYYRAGMREGAGVTTEGSQRWEDVWENGELLSRNRKVSK